MGIATYEEGVKNKNRVNSADCSQLEGFDGSKDVQGHLLHIMHAGRLFAGQGAHRLHSGEAREGSRWS